MRLACIALLLLVTAARASELTVQVPADAKVTGASAKSSSETVQGTIGNNTIHFKLRPDVKYDVRLEFADDHIGQGVDLSWYNSEPADPQAAVLDDEDRKQIQAILDIKSFYDRTEALDIRGDHDRAVVLVQRIRDSKFHSANKDESIWCVEVWYLKDEAGGWAKVSQQDRVVRRDRFASAKEMKETIERIHWRGELGGVVLKKDESKVLKIEETAKSRNERIK
jgi:hypothetical protein